MSGKSNCFIENLTRAGYIRHVTTYNGWSFNSFSIDFIFFPFHHLEKSYKSEYSSEQGICGRFHKCFSYNQVENWPTSKDKSLEDQNFHNQVEEQISRFLLLIFLLVRGSSLWLHLLSVQGQADGMKREIWAERKRWGKLWKGATSLQPRGKMGDIVSADRFSAASIEWFSVAGQSPIGGSAIPAAGLPESRWEKGEALESMDTSDCE